MLSSDLFSQLGSEDQLALEGTCADDTVQQQQQHYPTLGNLSLFDELGDVVSVTDTLTSPISTITCTDLPLATESRKVPNRKAIEIKMGSDEEDELVKYLTGATGGQPPCLKLVRKSRDSAPSISSSPISFQDPGLCMSKNAVAARELRQKKKTYVTNLETSIKRLTEENKTLKTQTDEMKSCMKDLKSEVEYLRQVLANQSALAGLLENIHNTPGVKFQSSLLPVGTVTATSIAKKPTATVTGRVKGSTIKRKIPVAEMKRNITFAENNPHQMKKLKACSDHVYAADPEADRCSKYSTISRKSLQDLSSEDISVFHEEDSGSTAGICLHVSKGSVSIELCSVCSERASSIHGNSTEQRV